MSSVNSAITTVIRRAAAFLVLFSLVPLLLGLVAAARHSVHMVLLGALLRAQPGWTSRAMLAPVRASVAGALLLALGSLWAWREEDGACLLRVTRLLGVFWFAAFLLYPGIASWIPVVRGLPWCLLAGGGALALGAAWLWPGARANWREVTLAAVAVPTFYANPAPPRVDLASIAGRKLDRRDVLLVGFDSISHSDTADLLGTFRPSWGAKTVYANAWTPLAGTSPAWRSMLSGELPDAVGALPGAQWPLNRFEWLPSELAPLGYHAVVLQNLAETNTFADGESVRVPGNQGWQAIFDAMAWRVLFPLSDAGGRWWVALAGGPADSVARHAYQPAWFLHSAMEELGRAARAGPVLWASHSCYLHPPLHLTLREGFRLRGWWRRPPVAFEGAGNPFTDEESGGHERVARARLASVRTMIAEWLAELDRQEVLGRSLVVVLSDHGQRAPWVSTEDRDHVQLAIFEPGPRVDSVVRAPVSLVDVAATVRAWVGVPSASTASRALPRADALADPHREVPHLAAPTLASSHVRLDTLSPADVNSAVRFRPDGTYEFTSEFLSRSVASAPALVGVALAVTPRRQDRVAAATPAP